MTTQTDTTTRTSELLDLLGTPPLVKVDGDGDLCLRLPNGSFDYRIAPGRINTPERLLGWIVHLAEKNWTTPRMIREMVLTVSRRHGVRVERNL